MSAVSLVILASEPPPPPWPDRVKKHVRKHLLAILTTYIETKLKILPEAVQQVQLEVKIATKSVPEIWFSTSKIGCEILQLSKLCRLESRLSDSALPLANQANVMQ